MGGARNEGVSGVAGSGKNLFAERKTYPKPWSFACKEREKSQQGLLSLKQFLYGCVDAMTIN